MTDDNERLIPQIITGGAHLGRTDGEVLPFQSALRISHLFSKISHFLDARWLLR